MENATEEGIIMVIAFTAMLCLGLAMVAFYNIHRKNMLQKEATIQQIEYQNQIDLKQIEFTNKIEILKYVSEAEEQQRENIARKLHNEIIPILSAIETSIDQNTKNFDLNKFDMPRQGRDVNNLRESIQTIRKISHELIPSVLWHLGLIKALESYVDQISCVGNSTAAFENRTPFEESILFTMPVQYKIYTLCLEVLENLRKHETYTHLTVTVENDLDNLLIEFMHDGVGVTNEEIQIFIDKSPGIGLKSILAGALMLGGDVDYATEKDHATINLTIPLEQ